MNFVQRDTLLSDYGYYLQKHPFMQTRLGNALVIPGTVWGDIVLSLTTSLRNDQIYLRTQLLRSRFIGLLPVAQEFEWQSDSLTCSL